MKKENSAKSYQIKISSVVFLAQGILGVLFVTMLLFLSSSYSGKYAKYSNPLFLVFILIFAFIYTYQGMKLWRGKLTNHAFWLSIFLSIILIFNFPIGTIIGVLNVILLWNNKFLF